MFNRKLNITIEELQNKVKMLEIDSKKCIGEIYIYCSSYWGNPCYYKPSKKEYNYFKKFKQSDIQDSVDDKIKIFDVWLDKKDVILYDDIYNKQRSIIEKRYVVEVK